MVSLLYLPQQDTWSLAIMIRSAITQAYLLDVLRYVLNGLFLARMIDPIA